jgi:hypothetical protein
VDILEALAGEAPPRASGKCKLGRWLDEVVADHPNRADLVTAIETRKPEGRGEPPEGYSPLENVLLAIRRLGLDISDRTLATHRRRACRCFL